MSSESALAKAMDMLRQRCSEDELQAILDQAAQYDGPWRRLRRELDELAYGSYGVVTQLRDGYAGPDQEQNRLLLEACARLRDLIRAQGDPNSDQFDFCVDMMYELMKFAQYPECPWIADYGEQLNDALTVS